MIYALKGSLDSVREESQSFSYTTPQTVAQEAK